ncbi:MAG TPA: helix-turn-helix domain-containing protein [Candidatus Limnocylindria bacterium]|nr:helix-turn-helix domain-containing protein [Candidatus Limnocylindria bacterium]
MADRGAGGAQIGHRLRELRSARELSLRQLAKLIGASPSLLSQVENGKVTPSVDTLYELARALGVPVASFFGDQADAVAPTAASVGVVRAADRQRIRLETGVTWENLLPGDDSGLRFMEIHYPPGAHSGEHYLRHPGRDLFVVLEGELTFSVGFSQHRLSAGDAISFGDFQPHRVQNEGAVEARAIVCVIGDDEGHRPKG